MEKIWVIEDDESIRGELQKLLRANGYQPVEGQPCDLVLPLLMSVPVTWICVRFVSLAGFPQQAARTAMYGTTAAVVLAAAYGLYFLVSWLIAARQVMVKQM